MRKPLKENLIKLRKDKKLSQQEVANMLKIKRSTYSNWESGQSEPSLSTILNICETFGLHWSQLLDDYDIFNEFLDNKKGENYEGKISEGLNKNEKGKILGKISGKIPNETVDLDTWLENTGLKNRFAQMTDEEIREWGMGEIKVLEDNGLKTNILETGIKNSYLWVRIIHILDDMKHQIEVVVPDFFKKG